MHSVLIVDDEYGLAEMAGELLVMAGYTVNIAINGRLGLACVHQSRPDVVLLDLMMPIMSGEELLRVLKGDETTRDIPVILMSAAGREWLTPELVPEIAGFLQKPFTYDQLVATLTAAVTK